MMRSIIFNDLGADAGDEWKMNFANGGTFTFGNDIALREPTPLFSRLHLTQLRKHNTLLLVK